MPTPEPRTLHAGEREAGALCAHCSKELQLGDPTAVCRACGAVHHESCWRATSRCAAYACSDIANIADYGQRRPLTVTRDELNAAVPLPSRSAADANRLAFGSYDEAPKRWNRAAVGAFIVSLVGIPLFGLITGLIAIIIGCIALAGHSRNRRGLALAVASVLIGLFDVVGWGFGLSYYFGAPHAMVALDRLAIDPESLKELPDRIARAMRANVVVESAAGFGQQGFGSGVILRVRDGSAYIVTNRHVVDHGYSDETRTAPDVDTLRGVNIMTVEQQWVPGKVEWLAPHGVDLAIVSAPLSPEGLQEAYWDGSITPRIGDDVFAVGNPHGLGWTESAGGISQVRRRTNGPYSYRVLQITAAINPGNSGGGLYDAEGRLIGINTLTADKRFAEGLGFAISLPTLLDLVPDDINLPDKNPANLPDKNPEAPAP